MYAGDVGLPHAVASLLKPKVIALLLLLASSRQQGKLRLCVGCASPGLSASSNSSSSESVVHTAQAHHAKPIRPIALVLCSLQAAEATGKLDI